jgi:hypothetical protein
MSRSRFGHKSTLDQKCRIIVGSTCLSCDTYGITGILTVDVTIEVTVNDAHAGMVVRAFRLLSCTALVPSVTYVVLVIVVV